MNNVSFQRSNSCCRKSTIYYENVNTREAEESSVLNTAFKCVAQMVLTRRNLGSASHLLDLPEGSRVKSVMNASMRIERLDLKTGVSGFLTLGKPDEHNNILFWERKWCTLNDTNFSVYKCPQDEENGAPPDVTVSLEYCLVPLIKNPSNCPRSNVFVLKTGRPSQVNESNITNLRRKDNFVLQKYYLRADTKDEYEKWTGELESVLECLQQWQRLVFLDDYY